MDLHDAGSSQPDAGGDKDRLDPVLAEKATGASDTALEKATIPSIVLPVSAGSIS